MCLVLKLLVMMFCCVSVSVLFDELIDMMCFVLFLSVVSEKLLV